MITSKLILLSSIPGYEEVGSKLWVDVESMIIISKKTPNPKILKSTNRGYVVISLEGRSKSIYIPGLKKDIEMEMSR